MRTTVFKKTDIIYQLKMKSSRAFFSEMNKAHGSMPFSLRSFKDEKQARLGVTECVNREVVEDFKVIWEKDGEFEADCLPCGSGAHARAACRGIGTPWTIFLF